MKRILLVEPNFPIPNKSKNHKNFLPIGLLKLASYLKKNKIGVQLVRGIPNSIDNISDLTNLNPDEVWITSLFTYWSKYVREASLYYKELFPKAKIIVGGIYASLMPEHCKQYTKCDEVYIGVYNEAENSFPAYDLVDVNYQIIHASRGCIRRCKFCGTYIIEPKFKSKKSISDEIKSNRLIFYDNNFLANRHIDNILKELEIARFNNRPVYSECQSGFDGRILTPGLAVKLKKARFINVRIAWDNDYEDYKYIERQISYLIDAGYNAKDIYVFMLYNYELPFEILEEKRKRCYEWGVQIADCRFRPLNQTFDNYNPHEKEQSNKDYYIHPNWNDKNIREFRKNVRRQNICVRQGLPFYSKDFERKKFSDEVTKKVKSLKYIDEKIKFLKLNNIDFWLPM
jgi:hypothetical protein